MKKNTLNFIINVLMFLCLVAISGIGFLIKYILISGQERWIVYGENVELYFLNMDRHQWGDIHLILGFVMLGLLVLHIVLHWKIITCVYQKMIPAKVIRRIIAGIFLLVTMLFIGIPFIVQPRVGEVVAGVGRKSINSHQNASHQNSPQSKLNKEKPDQAVIEEHHHHADSTIQIKGFMSLQEVSGKYAVPTNFIKTQLNIPLSESDQRKLGWLRKKYFFKMSQVEKIIADYQKDKQ